MAEKYDNRIYNRRTRRQTAAVALATAVTVLCAAFFCVRVWASSPVLPETPDAGLSYQDSLTFLGDSLTAHLVSREVLTGRRNTTQVWRTASGMLNLNSEITEARIRDPYGGESLTIAEAAAKYKPPVLVITLGTDWGVSYLGETDFKHAYRKLICAIREASPDTILILQSIYPVTESCAVLTNAQIDRANGWVVELAETEGCAYLDTCRVLKDESGALAAQYCDSADGIHLNRAAYEVILAYIRTHAYKGVESE